MARRTTVAKALQAADARAAMMAEKPSISSSSGLLDVQERGPKSLVTGALPVADTRTLARQPSETSSATLGSAAFDAAPVPRRPGVGVWFGGVAAVGALAAGVAGLIYVLRASPSAAPAGAAAAVATATSPPPARAPATGDTPWVPAPVTSTATATAMDAGPIPVVQAPSALPVTTPATRPASPGVTKPPSVSRPVTKPTVKRSTAASKDESDDGF